MGMDYRVFIYCDPAVDEKLLPIDVLSRFGFQSQLLSNKFDLGYDDKHVVLFSRIGDCLVLDTTIRFKSEVNNELMTNILNTILELGEMKIYITNDCCADKDEDAVRYFRGKSEYYPLVKSLLDI